MWNFERSHENVYFWDDLVLTWIFRGIKLITFLVLIHILPPPNKCNVQQTLQNFVQEAESVRVNMADLAGL